MDQMSQNTYQSYVCSISDVIDLIETAPEKTPIIVDFDETLFLRNSTEEYLNTLQPRVIGAVLLGLLDYLKPWNWLPGSFKGEISRDWLRVMISTLLLPWTLILWYWRAQQLAHLQENTDLLQAIARNMSGRVIVATKGFAFRDVITHRSPKFGGESEIALSSGDEWDTDDHHRARRRHSAAT